MYKWAFICVLLINSLLLCYGKEDATGTRPDFKLVTNEKNYPERKWQVPLEFFGTSENIDSEFLLAFFRKRGIALSSNGAISYLRSNHVLMAADTTKNLRKINAEIKKFVKSVEMSKSLGLSPTLNCGQFVNGKLKCYPYPPSLVASFFANLDYLTGSVSKNVGGFYVLVLEREDSEFKSSKAGRKSHRQLEKKLMRAFHKQREIACIVVLGKGYTMSDVPDDCVLPVIKENNMMSVVREIQGRGRKKVRGTNFWEDDDENRYDARTRKGRFFCFLRECSDFGIRSGLYNRYGVKVDSISTRSEMLEYLLSEKMGRNQ